MSIIKQPYYFNDGRVGTLTKSDKFYKTIEVEEGYEVETNGVRSIEMRKVPKDVYYKIRKKGTSDIYDEAIDIIYYEYEEVSESEMEAEYGSNK